MLANRQKIALAPYNIRSLRFADNEAMVGECWESGGSAKTECVPAIRWGGFNIVGLRFGYGGSRIHL